MSRLRYGKDRRRDPQFEDDLHPGTLAEGYFRSHEDIEARHPPASLDAWFRSRRSDVGFPPEIAAEADRVFPCMSDILPPATCGPMAIQRRGGYGEVTVLAGDETVWMSDSLVERVECLPVVRAAHGDVLILGLGMGLVPLAICATRAHLVRRIEIVEVCTEVIMLVWPTVCWARRQIARLTGVDVPITLYEADGRDWDRTIGYDTIWADIWAGKLPEPGRMAEYERVEKKMRRALTPGGWYGAWFEPALRRRMADPSWPVDDLKKLAWERGLGERVAAEMAMACVAPGAYREADAAAVDDWRAHLALPPEERLALAAAQAKRHGRPVKGHHLRLADGRWEAKIEMDGDKYGTTGRGGSPRAAIGDLEVSLACDLRIRRQEQRTSWTRDGLDPVFRVG